MPKLELYIYVMYIGMCILYTYTYLCECIHMCVYRVYTNTRYIKSQGKIIPTPGKFWPKLTFIQPAMFFCWLEMTPASPKT